LTPRQTKGYQSEALVTEIVKVIEELQAAGSHSQSLLVVQFHNTLKGLDQEERFKVVLARMRGSLEAALVVLWNDGVRTSEKYSLDKFWLSYGYWARTF